MSSERPPLIAWACDAGEAVLLRHLRTINHACVPGWAAAGSPGPDTAAAKLPAQTVLFRHWDPSVLEDLLPVLDAMQFARILGPAKEIAFVTPDTLRLRQVPRGPDWPPAPRGLLTLSTEQMLVLADRRVAASNRRLAAYLRDVAPDHVAHLSEAELRDLAARHQREALGFGIRADRETFMWSFMRVTSVGDLSRDEGIVRLMADQRLGTTPEARLQRLYDMRLQYLRHVE